MEDIEEYQETQGTLTEDKSKMFEDEEKLPMFDAMPFVKKDYFVKPLKVKLNGVQINRFGRPELKFYDAKNVCYKVNISKLLYNQILETCGRTNAQIKGKEVTLRSVEGVWETQNGKVEGWNIIMV